MRRSMTALWMLAWMICPACGAIAQGNAPTGTATGTTWMTVLLDGRKVGSLQIERTREHDAVTTTQTLSLQFNRVGQAIRLESMSRTVETPDGAPLGFAARSTLSGVASTVEGRPVAPGQFQVDTTVGGERHRRVLDWPTGALMFDGQRRAMLAADHAGSHYMLHTFDPASQQALDIAVDVLGKEIVNLPGGPETLSHQRQRLQLPDGTQVMDLWLDGQGIARKGTLSLLGQSLDMLVCDRACAEAPAQGLDMFHEAMVPSPRLLTPNLRFQSLRYRIHVNCSSCQPFASTDEQLITPLDHDNWLLDIGNSSSHHEPPPTSDDLAANAWLQSDAPEIRRLAAAAVGDARGDRNRMRRLHHFVSGYITQHGLDVGYASALEVARSRKGDCTEYAVLLAALARAEGIPARVVVGMVYASRFDGMLHVFVPHAWTQAWVDGRWESYDAALHVVDATHIALAAGDGDPSHFFAAASLFGRMRIDAVAPLDEALDGPSDLPTTAGNGGGTPGGGSRGGR